MTEDRLIDIETKLSYQEDLVEELNKTVYRSNKSWSDCKRSTKRSQENSAHWLTRGMTARQRTKGRRIIIAQPRPTTRHPHQHAVK
jgi:uncharacterized coiled-coil protein SlyX